jgi:hypothetical protein
VYGRDVLSAVKWLQDHLSLYLAQLVGINQEVFSKWKGGGKEELTRSQVQVLESFSAAMNRLLSFYNFRRELMTRVLEARFDEYQIQPTKLTPPWRGTSLREYMLSQGLTGVNEVDSWVQRIRSANSLINHLKSWGCANSYDGIWLVRSPAGF